MKKHLLFAGLSLLLFQCKKDETTLGTTKAEVAKKSSTNFTQYVNPFIGTSKMGHVFPGATVPFGMVQLSPQTNFQPMFQKDGNYNPETYEYC
ncbi:MAG: glycoside hydrolase family 92 protein, partial [Mangrovimonas sp.]|nr:glycoside hydrolase family 92 protein [Mangrovimonas sp.]